jgi:heat shock protein HslJ
LLLALPLLSTCAGLDAKAPDRPGSIWRFVAIDGKPPVSDTTSLEVREDRISVNVGCNGIGGNLKFEPGRLIVDSLVSTMMYCDGLMEQERAVRVFPGFFIENGRMAIRSGEHSAELVKAE